MSAERRRQNGRRARLARVEVAADRGVFMISVAAELARMHPQTLRTYEARGLITPQRSPKGTRLYSRADVDQLLRIQEMVDLGLNLAGVERVLELEAQVRRLQGRVRELERREELAQERLAEAIEEVRRAFRAEIVPYASAASTALVRALDARSPFPTISRRSEDAA